MFSTQEQITGFIEHTECPIFLSNSNIQLEYLTQKLHNTILSDIPYENKEIIIDNILEISLFYFPDDHLGITDKIITRLLFKKEESKYFVNIYHKLIQFCLDKGIVIFTYNHLYHLVLQKWMDTEENSISNRFRKHLITIGCHEVLSKQLINEIKNNSETWFANMNINAEISSLINWLCQFDKSGELTTIKNTFQRNIKRKREDNKLFQRTHNITSCEYQAQQEKAKRYGLCKFVRDKKKCIHGIQCKFYHGKIEETYGVQPCRNHGNCKHFNAGECKFAHEANQQEIKKTQEFYQSLNREDDLFYTSISNSSLIDAKCKTNPLIILKKDKIVNNKVYYSIPICTCTTLNQYGVRLTCNKPVKMMTIKNNKIMNFYCCYEHMVSREPNSYYRVKQNILDDILD